MELILEPEECVTVYVTSETRRFPETVGSVGTMEIRKYVEERKSLNEKNPSIRRCSDKFEG